MRHLLVASFFVASVFGLSAVAHAQGDDPDLVLARERLGAGKPEEALAAVRRALELDRNNLPALRLLAELALAQGDKDEAVHALHSWSEIVQAQRKPAVPARDLKAVSEQLLSLDPEAKSWSKLQDDYVAQLLVLLRDYKKRKDWLAAIEVCNHVLEIDPEQREAAAAIDEIRRTGGKEVAVDDVFAGGDPTLGKSPDELRAEDQKHRDWDNAWTKQTENYRYRTNAGFVVLETAAIAMEQVNRLYRKLFHYKEEGGKTPKIEVRIFASRDEYLKRGTNPVEWSGGQFTGDSVETYVGGVTGQDSIRSMYGTLFHEAAHQFVSLTGPSVPGWLNEAYASFFEGCVILSNGSVRWNQAPPHRLFPLATRLEHGWMRDANDGVRDEKGEWATPRCAPTVRTVVSASYEWGPPWYAPTWGLVYFLYNYRSTDGRPVYRDPLHAYYESFKKGQPQDQVAHFEEVVLRGSPLSPVKKIDELDAIWKAWTLELRDRHTGKLAGGDELIRFGDAARDRGELQAALEFYEEALIDFPSNIELLQNVADVAEKLKLNARAAAVQRRLKRELELQGLTADPRYTQVASKVLRLDPLAQRYAQLQSKLAQQGLQLAQGYEERGLPTMALEIARRMSGRFSLPAALDFYVDVARRTGKTLARWRRAYDGRSLDGWSGSREGHQAYGQEIRAHVTGTAQGDGILTQELVCDVTFDADFSLEAEMRADTGGDGKASWMGLCFGRKGDQNFHAVMLHPDGFMDISTNRGGVWEVRDHRSAPIGDAWHRLRIDVTGKTLDVYLDGLYVRALDYPNPETVRGAFGLITGAGKASYRNIRILARDAFDPAVAIERRLAMERIAQDASLRQSGSFAGGKPPALTIDTWVQGEAANLDELTGKPVVLAFWSPVQDEVIPTAAYLAHLADAGRDAGVQLVVICDGGTKADALKEYLKEHPIPGARIGIDEFDEVLPAYWVKESHHGLPRILLLDRSGIVVFEGDPGLRAGVGWKPGTETYVDAAFDRLLRDGE
jgi:tetratricopeptide (TPR) repeat protein